MMKKIPQRKNHKTMTGYQLLTKAVNGSHKLKTENEKKNGEIAKILKK